MRLRTLRTTPFYPFILSDAGLADHYFKRSWWIAAVSKVNFDNAIRRVVIADLNPGFVRAVQLLEKTESTFLQKFRNVPIRPIV